jgi:formylglycine-generating enzyme
MKPATLLAATLLPLAAAVPGHADTFGSGANTFTIDFVTVGNAGNADDTSTDLWYRFAGGVPYVFRMGVYEIPEEAITKATASGMTNVTAGAWSAQQPAANLLWYEAMAFANWLNTSAGYQPAYNLTFNGSWSMNLWSSGDAWQLGGQNLYRHKNAHYFLPSDDEWYKAGYHKNDGVTGNYWDFPTGSNAVPNGIGFNGDTDFTAVFSQNGYFPPAPHNVNNVGAPSPYGTYGQGGNIWEWNEDELSQPNDSPVGPHVLQGGYYDTTSDSMKAYWQSSSGGIASSSSRVGFRVASIPEPGSAALLAAAAFPLLLRRRRRR